MFLVKHVLGNIPITVQGWFIFLLKEKVKTYFFKLYSTKSLLIV